MEASGQTIGPAPRRPVGELREIRGPSAFGGSPRRFAQLLWIMSVNEFRLSYANTVLGFFWTILRPLVFFGVIFMIIRGVLRFGANIENYAALLVIGLIIYQYFSEATNRAVRSVSVREGVVRKMQFPRIIVPLSVSLTAAFTMILNLAAVLPLLAFFGIYPELTWLLLVFLMVPLLMLATGLGLLLSVTFVRFEDIAEIWALIARMLLYLSPILYPIDVVPERFQAPMLAVNPLAPIIEQARSWIIGDGTPGPAEVAGVWLGVVVPLTTIGLIAVAGFLHFRRRAPHIAEAL
jgi:ABC-2 type transport system permease protein